jgi:hypothetical protein
MSSVSFSDRGRAPMSVKVFLSTVSDEFRPYRDQLRWPQTKVRVSAGFLKY